MNSKDDLVLESICLRIIYIVKDIKSLHPFISTKKV